MMQNVKVEYLSVEEIKPYENNPRKNENAVAAVIQSIKEFGMLQPLVIDKDSVLVAGHTRFSACKELKMKKVPCIKAENLTEEQIKAYRIADNSTGELSEWDKDLLKVEIDSIDGFDLNDFGLNLDLIDVNVENREIKEVELKPYKKVHYLISLNLDEHDSFLDILDEIKKIAGVEIESSLN